MSSSDTINALKTALSVSPENVPLRLHLASIFIDEQLFDDAERLFKEGLEFSPGSSELLAGLANCFMTQGKNREALVIAEDLDSRSVNYAHSLLYAKVLFRTGDVQQAVSVYKNMIASKPQFKTLPDKTQFISDSFHITKP